LAGELARIGDMSKANNNDLVRASVLVNQLKTAELSLSKRLLENESERKQTMLETRREFERTLIGAGPGEILRKLATSRLSGPNGSRLTAGSFFALSSEARQDAYSLLGGERMAHLNTERRALGSDRLGVLN